jgi:hypothetical protein
VVSGVQAVASGRLIVAVTKDGRVLSYAGNPARGPGGLAGLGSAATESPDESSTVPGGTAYVLTQLFTGANVPFTLTAKAAA